MSDQARSTEWGSFVSGEVLIPREILFENPRYTNPKISPDGKLLSYLAPFEGVQNIWLRTLGMTDDRPASRDRGRGINHYFWSFDSTRIFYLQDSGGDENYHLYRVDPDSEECVNLTPFPGVKARITGYHRTNPGVMSVSLNRENPRLHDVYRLNLNSGELNLIEKNPGDIAAYYDDSAGRILGATRFLPDGTRVLSGRESPEHPWKELKSWGVPDRSISSPLNLTADGKYFLVLDSSSSDMAKLVKISLTTGESEILAEDPRADAEAVLKDPIAYEPQAVSFYGDKRWWVILQENLREDFEEFSRFGQNMNTDFTFDILSRDLADTLFLLSCKSDKNPGSIYLYERHTKEFTFLFHSIPDLLSYTTASIESLRIKARDGLELPCYLTFPPGRPRKNLPMVLLVHGGPWGRDYPEYDPEVQWLANRGYLVLQVNFRGSTGFGKSFLNAGNREWGRKMQNDLTDAVERVIELEYADPARIGIFGTSYGGYAALMGAVTTPDLYKCAVDLFGPGNLVTLLKSLPPYYETELGEFIQRMGHPDKDREMLESRSPVFLADNIKIPVFIAQGRNDPRVTQVESDQIAVALKARKIPYKYLLVSEEGHGFAKPENRMLLYSAVEKFLATHLGGKYQKTPGEKKISSGESHSNLTTESEILRRAVHMVKNKIHPGV